MEKLRDKILSRLAIFAEGKSADETADAILALLAEDRAELVEVVNFYATDGPDGMVARNAIANVVNGGAA